MENINQENFIYNGNTKIDKSGKIILEEKITVVDWKNINKDHEIEDFDCLIGDENAPEISEEESDTMKVFVQEYHNKRTPEQKLKIELYSLYFNLEDSINQKAIEYSEKIPTSYDDEKKAIAVDYTEGAKNVLKELKKIINNIDK